MKILYLHLKREYFEDIKSGKKKFEYRLDTSYWSKRLVGKKFDEVHFKCGYPKTDDIDKVIKMPYRGYEMQNIRHPHFGDESVTVFAIYSDINFKDMR